MFIWIETLPHHKGAVKGLIVPLACYYQIVIFKPRICNPKSSSLFWNQDWFLLFTRHDHFSLISFLFLSAKDKPLNLGNKSFSLPNPQCDPLFNHRHNIIISENMPCSVRSPLIFIRTKNMVVDLSRHGQHRLVTGFLNSVQGVSSDILDWQGMDAFWWPSQVAHRTERSS